MPYITPLVKIPRSKRSIMNTGQKNIMMHVVLMMMIETVSQRRDKYLKRSTIEKVVPLCFEVKVCSYFSLSSESSSMLRLGFAIPFSLPMNLKSDRAFSGVWRVIILMGVYFIRVSTPR